jgi:acetyl-CoA/propionyl-CoA carboxylase biotin carboxyl carrier protein
METTQVDPLAWEDQMNEGRLFESVLVANRGEIACRIIRTLRALGIRSVAVFSDADRRAKHVAMADVAVRIGPAEASRSYLDIAAVIDAARASGAQAVHPGYGFLSESAEFARACADAGLVFIGPGERALEVMGDKIRAKQHVEAHGVATTPGIAEPGLSDEQLIDAAQQIGFPVLIKPSAGGGGKGMYAVWSPGELPPALTAARRIAASAFGDDTLFLERLVLTPRHIEVQVLADRAGHTIHLGERECSLQRRHQKVIEEAPSPLLDDVTRRRIGEAACEVARSVGYVGAGTVEFLVSDAAPDEFFFMEMNTRLQVEHPVTELVTGIDLVEWQIRIATGQPLTLAQDDVVVRGHAIEGRVYAEDPRHEFLPQAGRVLALREAGGDGIRVDSSLLDGLEIPPHYDPMLAKIVAWGEDRAQAIARLERALGDTVILGVHTNLEYLAALLAEPAVRAGALDTDLIERTLGDIRFLSADDELVLAAVAGAHAEAWQRSPGTLWSEPSGWRLGRHRAVRYSFATEDGRIADAAILGAPTAARAAVAWSSGDLADVPLREGAGEPGRLATRAMAETDAGTSVSVETLHGSGTAFSACISVGGTARTRHFARDGGRLWIADRGAVFALTVRDRALRIAEELAAREQSGRPVSPELRSPMPGTVAVVEVSDGDEVESGDTILTVEAMKMEHRLLAPVSGRVSVSVRAGDQVKAGQLVAHVTVDVPVRDEDPPAGSTDPRPLREEPSDAEPAG